MASSRKAHAAHTVRGAPREVNVAERAERAYPDLATLGSGDPLLSRARKLARTLFAAGAAAGLAASAAGCEPPSCQPTRLGELETHGSTALTELGDLQLKDAAEELGIGAGVVPHPVSMPLAGAMPVPYIGPPPPTTTDDAGTTADVDAGAPAPEEPTS